MNHKHFEELTSTQDYLRELKEPDEDSVLVSCERQTSGHGQYDRKWQSFDESLCFSFLLAPNEVLSLSSLEVGCLIHSYFKQSYHIDLALKWPNDVMTMSGEKVGGILINNTETKTSLVVGIGLNYFKTAKEAQNFRTPYGFIFDEMFTLNKKEESSKIYEFILKNRLNKKDVINYWNRHCFHLNKQVTLIDSQTEYTGVFKGIGQYGQAILKLDNATKEFYSGSIILS